MSTGDATAAELAGTYWRVVRFASPYRWQLLGMLVLSVLSTPLALLAPVPLKIAVDSVLGELPPPRALTTVLPGWATATDRALLLVVAALVVVIAAATNLRSLVSQMLRAYTGQRIVLDVRARLFAHAQDVSLAYHDERGAADSTYRIHNDASEVKTLAVDGLLPFVGHTVKIVAMLGVTAAISPPVALVALVVAPVLVVIMRVYAGRLRREWTGFKQLDSALMGSVQETLSNVRVVKAFGQEEREHERFVERSWERVRARVRLAFQESAFGVLTGLTMAAGTAAVLWLGVGEVQAGDLTLGNLLLVMGYLSRLYDPLERISEKGGELQSSLVAAERVFCLLDEEPEVTERPGALPLRRARGAVTFDQVSFAYLAPSGNGPRAAGRPVLSDVTVDVAPGARVGVVGATGAGKTTLISLLLRFYDPTAGRILLDGVDLRDHRLADLRRQFAVVLQEPVLFSTSIAENIAYARPGATNAEIVRAARAAHIHVFVSGLPDGYDSRVGERGMRLSGGERQRIALARAFLVDAPVLLLDEPTSAVDRETESLIMAAMHELMQGRTAFFITHRTAPLHECDTTLVLDDGRLAEVRADGG